MNKFKMTFNNAHNLGTVASFKSSINEEFFTAIKNTVTDLADAVEVLENGEIIEGFYSYFFGCEFDSEEQYDEYIKANAENISFKRLATFEEFRTVVKFVNYDRDIEHTLETAGKDYSAEQWAGTLSSTVEELKAMMESAEEFNQLADEFNAGEIGVELLAVEVSQSYEFKKLMMYTNYDGEHIEGFFHALENLATIKARMALEAELATKATAKPAKKMKI